MKFIVFSLLLSLASYLLAEQQNNEAPTPYETDRAGNQYFIRDYMYVPLRSGESPAYRIVHKGLKSGSIVTLMKQNSESGYSLVVTSKGIEGWIPSQYLMEEPTAQIKLDRAEKKINTLINDMGPTGEKLQSTLEENNKLNLQISQLDAELKKLDKQYKDLLKLSSNAVELETDYQEQLTLNARLKIKVDTLAVENDSLKTQLKSDDFINGALVLFLAVIILFVAQYFIKNRRRSEWR